MPSSAGPIVGTQGSFVAQTVASKTFQLEVEIHMDNTQPVASPTFQETLSA